jgi:hypothetical protein
MKNNALFVFILLLLKFSAIEAQHFQKSMGGIYDEGTYKMIDAIDGGYLISGYTSSYGNSPGNNVDGYLIKTDPNGNIIWTKTYGSMDADQIYWVETCSDSTYMFCGQSIDMITGNSLLNIAKISLIGDLIWQKNYKVGNYESGSTISMTNDGGFILGGQCDISSDEQLLLLKADSVGNVIWKKYFGGPDIENTDEILQLSDGGFLIVGTSRYGFYSNSLFLIRTDSIGNQLWAKTYNTAPALKKLYPGKMIALDSGGFILAGTTNASGQPLSDVILMRLDDTGNIQWQKIYVTAENDRAEDMLIDEDGNYLIAGATAISSSAGFFDAMIMKIDTAGNFLNAFSIGIPTEDETAVNILLNDQQEIIVSGTISGQGVGEQDIFLFSANKNYDSLICNSVSIYYVEDSVAIVANVYNGNWTPVIFETTGVLAEDNGGIAVDVCSVNAIPEVISGLTLVYPNPATDELKMICDNHIGEKVSFKIINMIGEIVKVGSIEISSAEYSLDIRDLSPGCYNFLLEFKTSIENVRFVKNK